MLDNICVLTDSYKVSHWPQYPPGTEDVYSYFESRGGEFDHVVFFGLQYCLKRYLAGVVVTEEKIQEAKELFELHFGSDKVFNEAGWRYILENHGGKLPLEIKAIPEGTRVGVRNVLMTVHATDPKCYWLTNYTETILVHAWYGTTVATLSYEMKKMIGRYLEATGDIAGINFKLHDFGFRGVSSVESAAIGGAAHLVNFQGTDTLVALQLAREYYKAGMPGFSINAAEHSTITSWGREREVDAYRNMLTQYPTGLVAVVSDSYDIYNACRKIWGEELRDQVLGRDGCLIIRPDSGHPPTVVERVIDILAERFGYTVNDKGYKVLNPKVRVIQGDGIDYGMCEEILSVMMEQKWSADNIAFGMGGGLLQKLNRDTQRFAFKCSAIKINGQWNDVFKQPLTDSGKVSKKGMLKLIREGTHEFTTVPVQVPTGQGDYMQTVFLNGGMVKEYTFDEVRENVVK